MSAGARGAAAVPAAVSSGDVRSADGSGMRSRGSGSGEGAVAGRVVAEGAPESEVESGILTGILRAVCAEFATLAISREGEECVVQNWSSVFEYIP